MGPMGKDVKFAANPVSVKGGSVANRVGRRDEWIVPRSEDIGRGVVFPHMLF